MSSSVKQEFIRDMQLAGLSSQTQKVYLGGVVRFVRHTRTRPQDAAEGQVANYLRQLVQQGRCHGTLSTARAALQFIFLNTLGRQWQLLKKESLRFAASVCPRPPATQSAAV